MTLFITESEVTNILSHKKTVELLDEGMKALGSGKAFNMPRKRLPVGYGGGAMNFMAASWPEKGVAGHKSYVVSQGKATFVVLLYSTEGEGLLAVIEANMLGQIRTGAASALASKYLANSNSKSLTIVGSGFQAESQLLSIASIFDLENINVYSRSEDKRNLFASKMSKEVNIEIKPHKNIKNAVEGSDIVCLITNSSTPVLPSQMITNGMHINAAGGNNWLRSEISSDSIGKFDLISCDNLEQAKYESKALMEATEKGIISWNNVNELGSLIYENKKRESKNHITLYESLGIAIQDLSVAKFIYDQISATK
jgi:alanine dehydrogenase|tara:strand:+ start:14699 stop:15634 length:936 start_codon:yes stop_codon:yes gene_type:complete